MQAERLLKLTREDRAPGVTIVRIDGILDAPGLEALAGLVRDEIVTLDLSGLLSLDRPALEFLLQRRRAGCRLVGASLHIKSLLGEVAP